MLRKLISALLALTLIAVNATFVFSDGSSGIIYPDGDKPLFTGNSSNHTLLLSYGGTVSAFGNNNRGQCGVTPGSDLTEPNYIKFNTDAKIVQVVAGGEFSLALSEDGYIWAWGDHSKGQLGIGSQAFGGGVGSPDPITFYTTPQKIGFNNRITQIATGKSHALALDENGDVWAWGDNQSGQLGWNVGAISSAPVKVDGLSNVKYIATKYNHNLAVDTDNNLWAWGDNQNGQLGIGSFGGYFAHITKVNMPTDTEIMNIATGKYHSAVVTYEIVEIDEDNTVGEYKVYSFGDNSNSQLGIVGASSDIPVLTLEDEFYL